VTAINVNGTTFTVSATPGTALSGGASVVTGVDVKNWDAAWVFVKYKVRGNYTSAAGASSSGTEITVGSTTGLRVGMPVSVTGGTGAFSASTVVTAITDAIHFTVSAAPSPVLSDGAVVTGTAIWEHAKINTIGLTPILGRTITPATDGTGAFIYRDADGSGPNSFTSTQLRWEYGVNGVADGASVDIDVFAIEMVYVPQGSFYVGSGGIEYGAFYEYPATTNPYQITGEGEITVGTASNNLYYPGGDVANFGDQLGPIPAEFPKGYNAFYCMKYEIMQQQYVDFLNNLTQTQATHRKFTSSSNRYAITGTTIGFYSTTNPYVACNILGWTDVTAYLDWSGLRPMTELEFEKSSRGTLAPVSNEFAWGTTGIISGAYTLSNIGANDEVIATNYSTTVGNAAYNLTKGSINGPLRVGIFAGTTGNNGRVTSGATYYGIMEMSGNLWERPVTVGNVAGRSFTGLHGDGILNTNGDATVDYWPGINGNVLVTTANTTYLGVTGVTGAAGSGFRGGNWYFNYLLLQVSDRTNASQNIPGPEILRGGRGVRTAPL
jgi:formylglycine-generating enzyme required for sulfatase activity